MACLFPPCGSLLKGVRGTLTGEGEKESKSTGGLRDGVRNTSGNI